MQYIVYCEDGNELMFIGAYDDNHWIKRASGVSKSMVYFRETKSWLYWEDIILMKKKTVKNEWKKSGF